ncbi:MAG TPA: hypothetical protein VMJ31_07690 [Methylocystis sp.]|nr:hypothetical protein [Methylocystis sp.]
MIDYRGWLGWLFSPHMSKARLASLALVFLVASILPTLLFRTKQTCDPNERFVTDLDGRRFLELRWPIGSVEHRVRLRVPAEYVIWADTGCQSAVWPGYPDPNYTNPFAVGFAIGVNLPDFEILPPSKRTIFGGGIDSTELVILVSATARAKGAEEEKRLNLEKAFVSIRDFSLDENNIQMRTAHLKSGPKADKFGLKRVGVLGNLGFLKNEYSGAFAVDFYYVNRNPVDLWFECQAEENKDHDEDSSWHRRPMCKAYFRNARLDVSLQADFPRIYMDKWQEIRESMERILDSFEIRELNDGRL